MHQFIAKYVSFYFIENRKTRLIVLNIAADYVTKCGQTDPNINDCLVKSSNEVLPHILGGSKDLFIPNLTPLSIPHVEGESSGNFKFSADNITIDGCDTLKVTETL